MEDTVSSVDRISDLPNEVLTRILSLMSTKEAASTFMLSKRWNNLWASVPCLKFDYNEFLLADDDLFGEVDNAKLIRFINGVLRHRGSTPVDKFELTCGREEMHPHPAVEWVHHIVLNCKPRVLHLDIFIQDYNFSVPSSVFSCASLEEMELVLSSEYNDNFLPNEIYLPALKKLMISGTMLEDHFFDKLFLGSSLLEKLVLDSCMQIRTWRISSSSLKHLALRSCNLYDGVQIDSPSLIYLEVHCNKNSRILVKNLMSLINARVIIYGQDLFAHNTPGYLKPIGALANATTLNLTFSSDVMKEMLKEQLLNFPTFINLKILELGKLCMVNYFDLVAAFLQHSPNLQMLKLFHTESNGSNRGKTIATDTLFLKEYLQTVIIDARNAKDESVDLLVKQLRATVRTIGEIQIMKPRSSNWLSDFHAALSNFDGDLNDLDDAFMA